VVFKTWKMMQRAQNSHAHVNAAFFVRVLDIAATGGKAAAVVVKEARLAIGGVSKLTFEATTTAAWLKGKDLAQQSTLDGVWAQLATDLASGGQGPSASFGSQAYRESTMRSLFYRFVLCCQPGGVSALPPRLQSAAAPPARPISGGSEIYTPDPSEAPVSEPVTKIEAYLQTSGEARYTDDEPLPAGTLHGALVFSTKALGTVLSIDTSKAMALPGVVDVLTAQDVPGTNAVMSGGPDGEEPLFAPVHSVVEAIGVSLGAVLATSRAVAVQAAGLVEVTYGPAPATKPAPADAPAVPKERVYGGVRAPIISLQEAIDAGSFFSSDLPAGGPACPKLSRGSVSQALPASAHTLSGTVSLGGQKHFYFEVSCLPAHKLIQIYIHILTTVLSLLHLDPNHQPQTAMASPGDAVGGDSIHLVAATQGPCNMQESVSALLGLPNHHVDVTTRRSGGAFGGKLTRCLFTAGAASLGAWKHGVSVCCTNDRATDFAMVNGREAMLFNYDVGFDDKGIVSALKLTMYMDAGCIVEGSWGDSDMAMLWGDNTYYFANYEAEAKLCKTNNVSTTSMRSPGVVQSVFAVESIIERVANTLNLPVTHVQEANFYKVGQLTPALQPLHYCSLEQVWSGLKVLAKYDDTLAEVQAFNKANRFRKRGISMTPTKFGMGLQNWQSGATIKIFPGDGTVAVAHGGCEIGQGINTKVAQVAAYALGCDLKLVNVMATDTNKIPTNSMTGGSGSSESSSQAVLQACQTLKARIAPFMKSGKSWADAVSDANDAHVNLMSDAYFAPTVIEPADKPLSKTFTYFVWCAACSVVEVDVLTGQVTIISSTINYDCGQSLNPAVDIGQIEGAFVMGLGYFLTEEVVVSDSGALLSNGTWEYKPPCSQDIPVNFTVSLLKDAPNPLGVLRSKAVGEPPYAIANSAYFAVKSAVAAARADTGLTGHFEMPSPATVGCVQQTCATPAAALTLK
jgi:xanthine dehydrogenase/oxidase